MKIILYCRDITWKLKNAPVRQNLNPCNALVWYHGGDGSAILYIVNKEEAYWKFMSRVKGGPVISFCFIRSHCEVKRFIKRSWVKRSKKCCIFLAIQFYIEEEIFWLWLWDFILDLADSRPTRFVSIFSSLLDRRESGQLSLKHDEKTGTVWLILSQKDQEYKFLIILTGSLAIITDNTRYNIMYL